MPQLIATVEGVEIKHVRLTKDRTTLGRRPGNDIVLDNPVVSGQHCVFELRGIADVYVEDLGSTNGTYINGHMVKAKELLRDNDVLTIGNFQVQYLASSGQDDPVTAPQTSAMSLNALGFPGTSGAMQASVRVLTGSSAGLEMEVVKAVTTLGRPGVALVSLSHRRDGYYVALMDGDTPPTLNGQPIGAQATLLAHHDILNLAGTEMEFLLKSE